MFFREMNPLAGEVDSRPCQTPQIRRRGVTVQFFEVTRWNAETFLLSSGDWQETERDIMYALIEKNKKKTLLNTLTKAN